MSPAQKKKSGKKQSGNKKTSAGKRVKEVRLDAFRRGANTVLLTTILIVFAACMYLVWDFLGAPRVHAHRPSDRTACLELYFYDQALAYLVPVHRRVELAPADSRTEKALHEFAVGPRDPSLARVYPPNIPIPSVRISKGVATVDLPVEVRDYWQSWGKIREAQFLDALTMTVISAGESSKVRFLIAGQPQDTSPGGVALDKPLERPKFVNQVPDPSLGDDPQWATAYFIDSSGRYLFPLAIQIAAGADPAMESVKALLGSPPRKVQPPPRPVMEPGCTLDRLAIENGTATVSLRVSDPQTVFLAGDINVFRRALLLTLRQCCDVQNVSIELNGKPLESYSRFGGLPDLSQDNCWNLEGARPHEELPGGETTPTSVSLSEDAV